MKNYNFQQVTKTLRRDKAWNQPPEKSYKIGKDEFIMRIQEQFGTASEMFGKYFQYRKYIKYCYLS